MIGADSIVSSTAVMTFSTEAVSEEVAVTSVVAVVEEVATLLVIETTVETPEWSEDLMGVWAA